MPYSSRIAYVAAETMPPDAENILLSLHEYGFVFNGPEEMAPWFESHRLPFVVQPMDYVLSELSQGIPPETRRVFILHGNRPQRNVFSAQREALTAFLLTLPEANSILLVTHPGQYSLLRPEILSNPAQWDLLARQLRQDIAPNGVLPLQETSCHGDSRRLYSLNPAWAEAIEILPHRDETPPSDTQLKNVLTGTQLLLQLARTADVNPYQALLMQHGMPVQVCCHASDLSEAVQQVVFQNSELVPGATLLVNHELSAALLDTLANIGIQVVVSPFWSKETVSKAKNLFTPIAFHLEKLQLSTAQLAPLSVHTFQYRPETLDARHVVWQTPEKPTDTQRIDLEIGVALVESMPDCAIALMHGQQSRVLGSGMPMPMTAVELALSQAAGHTQDTVCVLTGEVFSEPLFNALIQARVAGVLILGRAGFPPATLKTLQKIPFFIGTYASSTLHPPLQIAGVRHG